MEKGSLPNENIQDPKYAAKQHVKELAVSRIQKENGYEVLNQFLRTMSYMQTKCKSGVWYSIPETIRAKSYPCDHVNQEW